MRINHLSSFALLFLPALLVSAQSGVLDPSFGVAGLAQVASPSSLQSVNDMILLPDGRMAGVATANHAQNGGQGLWIRFLPNGDADSLLGGSGHVFDPPGPMTHIGSLLALEDGRTLIVGRGPSQLNLQRYHEDGALDTSFAMLGVASVPTANASALVSGVFLTAQNEIVVGGTYSTYSPYLTYSMVLYRFSFEGTLLGQGIFCPSCVANAVMEEPGTGRILLAGRKGNHGLIARKLGVTSTGHDPSFNGNGMLDFQVPGQQYTTIEDIRVDDLGRIVACGMYQSFPVGSTPKGFVTRILPNGTIDTTFGNGGIATADLPTYSEWFTSLAVLSDGHIAVLGHGQVLSLNTSNRIIVALFDQTGVQVPVFGTNGSFVDMVSHNSKGRRIVQQPDGKLVFYGMRYPLGEAPHLAFYRMEYVGTPTGTPPSTNSDQGSWTMAPNPVPARGWLHVDLRQDEKLTVALTDLQGRSTHIAPFQINLRAGRHQIPIDTEGLAPGIYLIDLSGERWHRPIRFIKAGN